MRLESQHPGSGYFDFSSLLANFDASEVLTFLVGEAENEQFVVSLLTKPGAFESYERKHCVF